MDPLQLCRINRGHLSFLRIITTQIWGFLSASSIHANNGPHSFMIVWTTFHRAFLHKCRRWYTVMYRSGCSRNSLHVLLNYLEVIKNQDACTSSCWSFWPTLWQWNDASVTAEHHVWEFFNSLYVLLRGTLVLWAHVLRSVTFCPFEA